MTTAQTETTYEVVSFERSKPYLPPAWTNELGDDNEFASEEEALEAIQSLRGLGDEWADGIYGVRPYLSEERVWPDIIDHPEYGVVEWPTSEYFEVLKRLEGCLD